MYQAISPFSPFTEDIFGGVRLCALRLEGKTPRYWPFSYFYPGYNLWLYLLKAVLGLYLVRDELRTSWALVPLEEAGIFALSEDQCMKTFSAPGRRPLGHFAILQNKNRNLDVPQQEERVELPFLSASLLAFYILR